jgi:hypothetical protein
MAILKSGNDEYEVRIKRYPEKTYFDEYIKTVEREKKAATTCKRYIVGGDGVRYEDHGIKYREYRALFYEGH